MIAVGRDRNNTHNYTLTHMEKVQCRRKKEDITEGRLSKTPQAVKGKKRKENLNAKRSSVLSHE